MLALTVVRGRRRARGERGSRATRSAGSSRRSRCSRRSPRLLAGYTRARPSDPAARRDVARRLDRRTLWIVLVVVGDPAAVPGRAPALAALAAGRLARAAPRSCSASLGRALGDRELETEAPDDVARTRTRCPGAAGDAAGAVAEVIGLLIILAPVDRGRGRWSCGFRRSRGVERQQLKWFAYVGGADAGRAARLGDRACCSPSSWATRSAASAGRIPRRSSRSACRSRSAPRSCATGSTTSTS